MKTTKETLNTMADVLVAEKELLFGMEYWLVDTKGFTRYGPGTVENFCGTVACIAGTMSVNLDPKSQTPCDVLCFEWVLGEGENYQEIPALSKVFQCAEIYGVAYLSDISKDMAISKLREWAALDLGWEDLLDYLLELEEDY